MAKSKHTTGINSNKFILIVVIIFILDQLTKKYFFPMDYGAIKISLVQNTGISFGLFQDTGMMPLIVTILIIIGLVYYYPKIPKEKPYQVLTAFILGGAFGNLVDRLLYGHVIDFIHVWKWPAFNVADSAITIGAIGLIYLLWKKK